MDRSSESSEEYKQGYRAYFKGNRLEDNPYPKPHANSDPFDYEEYQDWADGFFDALDEDNEFE